jgi:multiple sugar transport system ATP-binding protein
MVYVTHDQVEAMTMGQRIAVMSDGVLQQVGTPQQLYDHPVNRFVAGFIGSPSMNFVEVDAPDGSGQITTDSLSIPLPAAFRQGIDGTATKLVVGFRPEHLELGEVAGLHGTVKGTADVVEYLGNEELLHVTSGGKDIVAIVDSENRVKPGDVVELKLPVDKLHLFNAETGASIERTREAAAA